VRKILPLLFLGSLVLALSGGILVLVKGVSTPSVVLLVVGLAASVGFYARMGGIGKLGGMDEREVSAAIRARAQENWDMARDHGKQA
jgi:hypothetical protein